MITLVYYNMAENSVNSYIDAQPESVMSYDQFWRENNVYGTSDPDNQLMVKIMNAFTGEGKRVRDAYDAYLTNVNNRNEYRATQSARAYEKMMDDSKVQRAMKDYEAAGLNPYLLINNGGPSVGSVPSSAKAQYGTHKRSEDKTSSGRDIALLLIGVARLAAALL